MQTLSRRRTTLVLVGIAALSLPAFGRSQQPGAPAATPSARPPVGAPGSARPTIVRAAARGPAPAARPATEPLVTYLNPDTLMQSDAYSKAVIVNTPSRTVYFSGCIPVDKAYNVVARDDLAGQVRQSLNNLALAMAAANLSKNDIVKIAVSIVYKDNRDTFTVSEALVSFFERDDPPVTTITGAPFIIAEGILVQIEAIGVLPSSPVAPGTRAK